MRVDRIGKPGLEPELRVSETLVLPITPFPRLSAGAPARCIA